MVKGDVWTTGGRVFEVSFFFVVFLEGREIIARTRAWALVQGGVHFYVVRCAVGEFFCCWYWCTYMP